LPRFHVTGVVDGVFLLSVPSEGGTVPREGARFADRLNYLMSTIPGPDGGEWTSANLHNALDGLGIKISLPYISQLRGGIRGRPSGRYVEAIAQVFKMPIGYFYDDQLARTLDQELAQLADLRRSGVLKLAIMTRGLESPDIEEVQRIVEYLRTMRGLPPAPTDSGDS